MKTIGEGIRVSLRTQVLLALGLVAANGAAGAEPGWSVPKIPGTSEAPFLVPPKTPFVDPALAPAASPVSVAASVPASMEAVARIGGQWGKVTSVLRTPEHNRKVGGVANSYHLSGRAIDIARRPGVRHADIAAALFRAGFRPVESLDEGDHSHFAFARAGEVARAAVVMKPLVQLAAVEENGQLRLRLALPAGRGTGR
jgi:hypothetical protein